MTAVSWTCSKDVSWFILYSSLIITLATRLC